MEPLDLTQRPPRGPRDLLPGLDLLMAARTVDKLRATLPGGNLGEYQITGFSSRMLEAIGIGEAALRAAIAAAGGDQDVAKWIREHSDPAIYGEFNRKLEALKVAERLNEPAFIARYPLAATVSPEMARIDLLVADDRATFPNG